MNFIFPFRATSSVLPALAMLTTALPLASCARAQDGASLATITEFDGKATPYGSFKDKLKTENGKLIINADDNKGGAYGDAVIDLSPFASDSPILRVRALPGNEATKINFIVKDSGGKQATWAYSLEGVGAEFTTIYPLGGASLGKPSSISKEGTPELALVKQWLFSGDYQAKPLKIEVDWAKIAATTDEVGAARAVEAKRLTAKAETERLEQIALKKKLQRNPNSPQLIHVAPVAPDVLSVEVQAGKVTQSSLAPYVPQDGDTKREVKRKIDDGVNEVIVSRDKKELGWLIGPNRETLVSYESLEGDPFLTVVADEKDQYSITSPDDANYRTAATPVAVHRKSKPNDWAQGPGQMAVSHILYFKLPTPMQTGKTYVVNFGEVNVREPSATFVNAPTKTRSEAVHVNQIGYRPSDPAKRAFYSVWMGTGGGLKLPDTIRFSVVEEKTGKTVFSGQSQNIWRADKTEKMARTANFSATDVAALDFSDLKTPGRYRVVVEGAGTSYPFSIGDDTWRQAFLVQMKGLYNQRSGMELGPPYTDFKKPRDMHPADGYAVYKTSANWLDAGDTNWKEYLAGAGTEKIDYAWGGYHDAGDWNPRRVTHMKVTMAQLEVTRMFPDYFSKLDLNIPSTKGVPDILTEAMWEFDTFLRLQEKNGGVGYGIESGLGDPAEGEVSWLNSYPSYVLASDYYNSWYFAAVGARLSGLLAPYDAKKAATYRAAAIAAFDFAEKDFARAKAEGKTEMRKQTWEALDNRNLAAIELYRLTTEQKYHDAFLENSALTAVTPNLFDWGKHVQREQAFVYATLPAGLGDEKLKIKAVAAIEDLANRALEYASNNAWNITTPDQGKPQFIGFYTGPDAYDLTRAHFLTGQEKYLAGAVQATQFGAGANPSNLVYTSGLGANPVEHAFKLDSRRTGQKAPVGLTPYGNIDFGKWNQQWITWPITYFVGKDTAPNAYSWPVNEAYWDVGGWPALNEFTVDTWAPNVQVWGYLAARK